jgi:AraC family transcriptional regulator, melibiose operon regulatory protein
MVNQTTELGTFGFSVWLNRTSPQHLRPHRHNEIELNYVEQGAVTYLYAGSEITIEHNQHAVFWGAVPHQLIHCAGVTTIDIATIPLEAVLQWELPQTFIAGLLAGEFFRIGGEHLPAYGANMYHQWHRDMEIEESRLALMEVNALLHRCARSDRLPAAPLPARATNTARQMAQFITRHFQQPLSVREVAEVVGLHPHYAMAVFKQAFDMTMINYLTQQRVAFVQQRLLTTDEKVIDIAYEAGFQTVSHFYASFNQLCGCSPGKYRAALRWRE